MRGAPQVGFPATRLPRPILPKARSAPARHRVGPDDDQRLLPPRPEVTEREPEEPISRPHPRSRPLGREDGELLAEGEVLDQKVGPRRCDTSEPSQDDGDSGEHRDRMVGCRGGVNDATGPDWRYDPPNANRSLSTRMGFWRATGAEARRIAGALHEVTDSEAVNSCIRRTNLIRFCPRSPGFARTSGTSLRIF